MSTSSQGKLVGSRGAMFRKTSTSKPDDWSDHSGKDVGAARNYAHEKTAVAKAEASKAKKEQDIINRTKAAAQRAKETLKMAKEDINEAKGKWIPDRPMKVHVEAMDKRDTADLKGMHDRWSGDHRDKKSDPSTSERLLAVHHVLKKRGESVPDLPQHKNLGMMRMHEESSGTEARVKIKNVARPDDAEPTSEKSKLSKTGEIKTKSVDEDIAASISRKYGLSSGLLEAAKGVMQGKTQVDLDPETDDREDNGDKDDDDVKKESKHTTPKSDKEKKLAALAHPKDKITHKDVLVGRGVLKKEETEIEEAIKPYVSYSGPRPGKSPSATVMAAGEKPHKTFSKDEHGADYKQKAMDYFKKNMKKLHSEEVEEIEELEKKTLGSYITKVASLSPEKVKPSREAGIETATKKYKMKEETDIDSLTEEELEEVLKKSDPAGQWISDFVHSKDPKFAGKSKKERMKQALGAYYAKQRNEEVEIEEGDQFTTKRRLDLIAKQEKKLPAGISPERKALAIRKQKAMKAHKAAQGMKEDVELSAEELERIESIAAQLDEAKPTIVSSPIRGANQPQSGFGVKNNVADYTISDEKKVRKEEVDDDSAVASRSTTRGKVVKAKSGDYIATNHEGSTKTFSDKMKADKHASSGMKEEVELEESPFTGIGKMLMKHKLKKGIKQDQDAQDKALDNMQKYAFADKKRFGHEGDFAAAHGAERRKERALTRLNREEVEELDESTLKDKITDKDGNRYELHLNVKGVSGHKDDHVIVQTHKNGKAIRKSDLGMLRSGGGNRYVSKDKSYIMKKFNSFKEEVEQIDELKKSTLSSYVKKASADAVHKTDDAGEVGYAYGDDDKMEKLLKKAKKRLVGVGKAADRLSKEEVELEEGRGRPKKSGGETEGDDTHKHPIQQLTKISHAIEGSEPHFEHKDGAKTKVGKHLAKHVMAVYGSMRTSQEKDDFANKLHASKDSMKSAVSKLF
jgi:hypothetical protein